MSIWGTRSLGRRLQFGLCIAIGMVALPPFARAAGEPEAVVRKFYQLRIDDSEMDIPSPAYQKRIAPFLTGDLARLLASAYRWDDESQKIDKGPPLHEGDLFTSNIEGVTGVKGVSCRIADTQATCLTSFIYAERHDPSPSRWTDAIRLRQTAEGWRIDDIGFHATWGFRNSGTLRETLTWVVKEGRETVEYFKKHPSEIPKD